MRLKSSPCLAARPSSSHGPQLSQGDNTSIIAVTLRHSMPANCRWPHIVGMRVLAARSTTVFRCSYVRTPAAPNSASARSRIIATKAPSNSPGSLNRNESDSKEETWCRDEVLPRVLTDVANELRDRGATERRRMLHRRNVRHGQGRHRPPKFHQLPAIPANSHWCGKPITSMSKAAHALAARGLSIERKLLPLRAMV